MKTRNQGNKQEEIIERPRKGVAARYGFVNRAEYRKSLRKVAHRGSNRRDNIYLMGRATYIPSYAPPRRKLKGWQKNRAKSKR